MRGVKSDDLFAIVDFIYCGEANVYHENLDSFLAIAEELQLKGLMGKPDEKDDVAQDFRKESQPSPQEGKCQSISISTYDKQCFKYI